MSELHPDIIFETEHYVVINKPAGLLVHPDGVRSTLTLIDWLAMRFPEIRGVGEPMHLQSGEVIARPGIVHRLDRETSGIMLIARTQIGYEYLKQLFKDRKVTKTYHAFVYGHTKQEFEIIDRPIGRSRGDFRKFSAQRGSRGTQREAQTQYRTLARFDAEGLKYSYLELRPKTGRTHQLRVHLKAINHPIVKDSLYAGKQVDLSSTLGFERVALHALSLSFIDNVGVQCSYHAQLPKDFSKAVENHIPDIFDDFGRFTN